MVSMEKPNVITALKDPKKNFVFRVRAYRQLTQREMDAAYINWWSQRDKRRSYKNITVEVLSIIGMND